MYWQSKIVLYYYLIKIKFIDFNKMILKVILKIIYV